MAENKFYDCATGKEVKDNPEEEYRQIFEHILVDDLGYPREHIDIEARLQRGSAKNAEI
ncbi:MAG: type I restriction enzyme HsdR N-terminal domain-containing protein [Synergistaceae bacterium]|nr:type I restriction enzyme HsdR N-terminal domain-containing protein [Synergistaceae bacterium]